MSQLLSVCKSGKGVRNDLRKVLFTAVDMRQNVCGGFSKTQGGMYKALYLLQDAGVIVGLPYHTKDMQDWCRKVLDDPSVRLSNAQIYQALAYVCMLGDDLEPLDSDMAEDEMDDIERIIDVDAFLED